MGLPHISIYEKLPGQATLEEAASGNPYYSTASASTSLQYPSSGARLLEPGKTFGGAIPALPGAIGTFEGAISAALTMFTKDQSTSLAVALTARLYNYPNSGVLGGIGLSREGETLAGVYHQLMALRKKEE